MAPQDTFIDDEEDTCPLCIEEFDLSDRGFRPCPCGYQICQFCFNNIKQNMNSLCPACRRPYDEKSIVWRVVTAEEHAEFRSNIQKNQKKRALEQRQKEVQKREAERENRKNLVGVRVVQKNLVYVTGLNPTVREDELLKTLRKPEFFGQYGNIQKISISNRKSPDGTASLGIYVTFEKKEDAQRCIQAVNGSMNGERPLKAQLGTTKYCSAWLRHEQCTNRQCMFLHELGDEEDSYTRQDLSSMNSINTQRPLGASSSRSASRQQSHPIPIPSSASQPMIRSSSRDESESGDSSALPAAASWARTSQVRSRRGSHATSGAGPSPAISMSLPVTTESVAEAVESSPTLEEATTATAAPSSRAQGKAPAVDNSNNNNASSAASSEAAGSPASQPAATTKDTLDESDQAAGIYASLVSALSNCPLPTTFLLEGLTLNSFPPLFDPRGGEKRRALRDDESRLDAEQDDQPTDAGEPSDGEPESSGSLALGGEPEDREQTRSTHGFDQRRGGPPPPIQRSNAESLFNSFGANYLPTANPGTIGNRSMTPQQSLYSRTPSGFVDHPPPGITQSQANLFQGQVQNRQASRYGFAGESAGGSAATIKLAANPRIMAQQSSMMPQSLHSQQSAPYYAASMPGPPPGLKSTGTPPAVFGQGFSNNSFGGTSKDSSQLLQDIIRGRGGGGSGSQAHDAGKREYMIPSFLSQYPSSGSSTPAPPSGYPASAYGPPPGGFQDNGSKQKKKGKKHRHANTSSSGGSGLVELADPSILQARLPHQQSNAGSGQGLFGSQAQDDELPAMDDVVSTVDALVSDEPTMMSYPYGIDSPLRSGTPSFPPGFGHMQPMQHPTPPPPPGFSRPMTPATSMTPVTAMTPSNLSQQAFPFPKPPVPVVPIVDLALAKERAETPKPQEEEKPQPVQPPAGKKATRVASLASNASSVATPVESVKAVKAPEAAPAPVAVPAPVVAQEAPAVAPTPPPATPLKLTKKNSVLQDEDFPALDAASASATKPAASTQARSSKPSTPVGKKTAEKRPVPAVLNLAAVSKPAVVKAAEASPALSDKHTTADVSSAFPSLPTPAAPWSPAVRAPPAPKTLRVVQTPKAESGPAPVLSLAAITAAENAKLAAASNLASSSSTPTLTSAVLANRQASLSNRPSTPASEIVSLSDNASVVSASISASRAGSPPPQPTRIGSAAVRNTTKSQQRKQRKQASKMDAAAVVEAATTTSTSFGQAPKEQDEEAVEIAPLMGRKKKQKKEKPAPAPAPAPVVAAAAEAPATETTSAAASAKAQKEEKEAKEKAAKEKEAKEAKETKERAKQSSAAKKKEDAKEKAAAAAAAEAATKAATAAAAEKAKSTNKAAAATAASASATTDATAELSAAAAAAAATANANATVSAPLVQVQKLFEKEQESLRKVLREAAEVAGSTTLSVVQNDVAPAKSDSPPPGGTIRSVALDLAARGMIDKRLENISFLQPFVTLAQSRNVTRNTVIKGDALLPPDVLFTKDDLNDIVAGKAVRKYVDDVRLLATPNGDCLRNLTEAEENRFMTLQTRLGNSLASPLSYMHPRYEETGGFDLIAKRAVPCGLPSYYPAKALAPAGVAGQMIFDPMSKIQREEAVYWINQYVLPRLNLLPQSEAASWQSMLVDTGVPQAIGTTTLAPWIYHTPEMRYGVPSSGLSSSSIPTSSIVTNGNGTAHADDDRRRESTSSNNTDGGPALGDHNNHNNHSNHSNGSHNHNSALTYTNGQSSASSAHPARSNGGPSGLIVDRDSVDLKNDLENSVHAMSVEDAERSLIEARREAKIYERALVQLIKMNGRLLLMSDESFAKIAGGSASASTSGGGPGSDAGPFDRSSPTPVVTTAY